VGCTSTGAPILPFDSCPRRVGHVGGPAVRGYDNVVARSAFVISFFPPRKAFSRRLMRVPKMRSCA
ncbi:hypothetical protein BHM03_00035535, partial [Ensete ventricosum]